MNEKIDDYLPCEVLLSTKAINQARELRKQNIGPEHRTATARSHFHETARANQALGRTVALILKIDATVMLPLPIGTALEDDFDFLSPSGERHRDRRSYLFCELGWIVGHKFGDDRAIPSPGGLEPPVLRLPLGGAFMVNETPDGGLVFEPERVTVETAIDRCHTFIRALTPTDD